MNNKITFVRRNGFAMAAAGAAAGIGNLWRFPYLMMKYEGRTFLATYLILVVVIGLVMIITEAAIGRKTGMSSIETFRMLDGKWAFLGWLKTVVPVLIVSFFSVVGGWSIKYYVSFISGVGSATVQYNFFETFIAGDVQPYIVTGVFIILTISLVMMGMKQGIAQISRFLIPILLITLSAGAIYVSTLEGAVEGLSRHLAPESFDFYYDVMFAAMGQVFFSMGLAHGVLLTLGTYIDPESKIASLSLRTCLINVCVAVLAGLVVVPSVYAVTGGNPEIMNTGPELMYVALSQVFINMGSAGESFGSFFFVLVFVAAIISSVTILEASVISLRERFHISRTPAGLIVGAAVMIIGMVCTLGYGIWSGVSINGMHIAEFIDYISGNILMPVIAFLTLIFIGYIKDTDMLYDEITLSEKFRSERLHHIMVVIITPVVIALIFITGILDLFDIVIA